MSLSHIKETQSAMLYVFCVLLTAILIAFKPLWGWVAILWGFLGFYRYLYLNSSNHIKIPKALTLPSRILFDLTQKQKHNIDSTIERLLQKDIIVTFICAAAYIVWGLYNSFHPLELELFKSFWLDKQQYKQDVALSVTPINNYAILEKISYYLTIMLIVFIGLTYSPQKKYLSALLLPLTALVAYVAIILPASTSLLEMNFTHFKGIGWGQYDSFKFLSAEASTGKANNNLYSGFFKRYIETGLMGALGLYIIFMPIAFTLLKYIKKLQALVACILLVLITCLDIFWHSHPLILSVQVLILAYNTLILRHFFFTPEKP